MPSPRRRIFRFRVVLEDEITGELELDFITKVAVSEREARRKVFEIIRSRHCWAKKIDRPASRKKK